MYRHSYCHRQFSFHCWASGLIVIRSVPLYYWNMRSYFVNITCCLGLSTYQLSLYGTCCRVVNFISNSNIATLIRPPLIIKYTHGSQIRNRENIENILKYKWIWRGSSSYNHFPQVDHFIAATKVPQICFTDTWNKKVSCYEMIPNIGEWTLYRLIYWKYWSNENETDPSIDGWDIHESSGIKGRSKGDHIYIPKSSMKLQFRE